MCVKTIIYKIKYYNILSVRILLKKNNNNNILYNIQFTFSIPRYIGSRGIPICIYLKKK